MLIREGIMSAKSEVLIRDLLGETGIEVGGSQPWDIQVHDSRFYNRLLREVALGLGESYMDGWWECERGHDCWSDR